MENLKIEGRLLNWVNFIYYRAVVPAQSNVIEAGHDMKYDNEKEWFYGIRDEKKGPTSFSEVRFIHIYFVSYPLITLIELFFPFQFQLQELYKTNVLQARTQCWAQGMETWRFLQQVPQLKWTFLAKGNPLMNESELASSLLSILIRMCQFFPSR